MASGEGAAAGHERRRPCGRTARALHAREPPATGRSGANMANQLELVSFEL
jgi:hypothetical protein